MFINGVKVTLTISLTIIVCCVLLISYSEYTNRYTVIPSADNSVYIFDKKSTVLNKCDENGCKFLETKLPAKSNSGIIPTISEMPSKMFGNDKPMAEEIVKTEATPARNNSESLDSEEEEEFERNKNIKQTNPSKENRINQQKNTPRYKNTNSQSTNKPISINKNSKKN